VFGAFISIISLLHFFQDSSFFAHYSLPINASFWVESNARPISQVKYLWHIARMGVLLSIKAKLVLAASARQELRGAMEEFNRACNTLSELAFQLDLHRRYDICSTSIRFPEKSFNCRGSKERLKSSS